MRVHLVQTAIDNGNPERNRERAAELVGSLPGDRGAEAPALIILPELFGTGTLPPDFDASSADSIAKTDRAFLAALARDTGAHVLAGILGPESDALHNLAVLFDPGGVVVLEQRKGHPFSLGGEDRIFSDPSTPSGGGALQTVPLAGFTMQAAVCYDLRFPELFRAGARRGADLFAVPANWPASRREHWEVLLRARAIENQGFVAGVNCVGTQRGTAYAGGSRLVSPKGEVLLDAGEEECVVSADISPETVRSWRRTFPALRDRKGEGFWF